MLDSILGAWDTSVNRTKILHGPYNLMGWKGRQYAVDTINKSHSMSEGGKCYGVKGSVG